MPSTWMRRRSSARPRIDGRPDTPPPLTMLTPATDCSRFAVSLGKPFLLTSACMTSGLVPVMMTLGREVWA